MPLTSDPFVIATPSILIGTEQFECAANEVTVEEIYREADTATICKPGAVRRTLIGCKVSLPIKLSYGAGGSFNLLNAMKGTVVVIVLKPATGAAAVGNPTVTFSAEIPAILPLANVKHGEVGIFDLDLMSDAAPVVAFL